MNTPAHLIMGAAAFGRPGAPWVTLAALAGAFAPDLSLYLMAGWHLHWLGTDPRVVFNDLYFSIRWQSIFAVDNSFLFWGLGFAMAWVLGSETGRAFTGAGLLHLLFDFPLHHDDGRPHFWPLSDWVFRSPVSYWDPRHYGNIIGTLELALSLVLLILLWRRFHALIARGLIALAAIAQLAPGLLWLMVFR